MNLFMYLDVNIWAAVSTETRRGMEEQRVHPSIVDNVYRSRQDSVNQYSVKPLMYRQYSTRKVVSVLVRMNPTKSPELGSRAGLYKQSRQHTAINLVLVRDPS